MAGGSMTLTETTKLARSNGSYCQAVAPANRVVCRETPSG